MQIYVVQSGDTIDRIAQETGTQIESIIYANQLQYPYPLAVGQALLLPNTSDNAEGSNLFLVNPFRSHPLLETNGYAYPFIVPDVLTQTLPFLSELSIFSYGFTTSGDLLPPAVNEEWMIREADIYQTDAILTLTPLGADGNFNNNLIHEMVRNSDARQNLIWQLYSVMQQLGYSGVDIDFEYILPEDRDYFTDFVRETAETLNPYGYQVSVALAPKTSADQPGLLYEGKDNRALGEAANRVLLMTYEWGYTYGPPMAVAPINMVRRVVEYALTEIPADKIHMGIPNYGYDWPLPYERGVTAARTIGNVEAVEIAVSHNAVIQYDDVAQSPYFTYEENGIQHEVWFEDVRSMQAKFNLIKEYNLRGAGYWQIMRLFRANWLLLEENFVIL